MKYCINGAVIHSDRAALPSGRKSRGFIKTLQRLAADGSCIDYGCGKLRHLSILLRTFDQLTVVDSQAQLTKRQIIHGQKTDVVSYCKRLNGRINVISAENIHTFHRKHDYALCINVLSAIPTTKTRLDVLTNIARLLKAKGQLLLITQFRNSRFSRFSTGRRLLDGHIFQSSRGTHFFGRIPPATISRYLKRTGFSIISIQRSDGYVIAVASKYGGGAN